MNWLRAKVAALLLALSPVAPLLMPSSAAAYSMGISGTACNYAGNYCQVAIDMWCGSNVSVTWYLTTSGISGYDTGYYYLPGGSGYSVHRYISTTTRVDQIVVSDGGTGCLRGAWVEGVGANAPPAETAQTYWDYVEDD